MYPKKSIIITRQFWSSGQHQKRKTAGIIGANNKNGMTKLWLVLLTIVFNLLVTTSGNAQSASDSFYFIVANPGTYAFTDRSVYSPGEDIKAFIFLMNVTERRKASHRCVYVCLSDPYTDSVLNSVEALLKSGNAQMSLHLPITIPPADYILQVVTNSYAERGDENISRSVIYVRSNKQPPRQRESV